MLSAEAGLRVRALRDLDDPTFDARWRELLAASPTSSVFQTPEWLRAWWRWFGRGQLLPLAVERDGEVVAFAPLFADEGMVYPVGSGGSDYLDLVGEEGDPVVLASILREAMERTPGFEGFRFYLLREDSRTSASLPEAAERAGLRLQDEGSMPAPHLDLRLPGAAEAAAGKKSLVRHEGWFRREGGLTVTHLRDGGEILPHLDAFFDQHVRRWAGTGHPSLFESERQRGFYRTLCRDASAAGWLRFTRLDWDGRPVAFHLGFAFAGEYLWYKPSFEIDLARRSPGEVLLRQLLLAARDEGCSLFDFGLGDEAFKQRFASGTRLVRTWGLEP